MVRVDRESGGESKIRIFPAARRNTQRGGKTVIRVDRESGGESKLKYFPLVEETH